MESSVDTWAARLNRPKPQKYARRKRASKPKKSTGLTSVCGNASANCCACVATLADHFKELGHCLKCGCNVTETRFGEILCELFNITGALCVDCVSFIKCILYKICSVHRCMRR